MGNFDHSDFNSLTGTAGTHDTAMTLFQIKPESCCVKLLKSETNLKDIDSISLPCQQRENFSSNKCITIPDMFKVKSELISEQEEIINSRLDDFSLNVLKNSKLVPNENLPTWGALNSLISNSKLPIMQTGFLPSIPYPVTEHTTFYTAMNNFIKVLQQLNHKALPIFCDEGFYRIFLIYISNAPMNLKC